MGIHQKAGQGQGKDQGQGQKQPDATTKPSEKGQQRETDPNNPTAKAGADKGKLGAKRG